MLSQLEEITRVTTTKKTTIRVLTVRSVTLTVTLSLTSIRAAEYLIRLALKLFIIIRRRHVRSVILLNIKRSTITVTVREFVLVTRT